MQIDAQDRIRQLPLPEDRSSEWAWKQFKPALIRLLEQGQGRRILEIGGGRFPLFTRTEVAKMGLDYTINDISSSELERAPDGYRKACFDIAGELPEELEGQYDLVFSKMVLEHVDNGRKYFENVARVLAPGGVALTFHPNLFCPPFVVNRLLPEELSSRVLRFFFPLRNPDAVPKFPARYSWCYSTGSHARRIRELGFQEVIILAFYGTRYFSKLPVVRSVDRSLTDLARKWDLRTVSSFAYTITFR